MALLVFVTFGKVFALVIGLYYYRFLSTPYKLAFYLTAVALFSECCGFILLIVFTNLMDGCLILI